MVDKVVESTDDNEQLSCSRKASKLAEIGLKLRAMMPWITENRLVDKDKN